MLSWEKQDKAVLSDGRRSNIFSGNKRVVLWSRSGAQKNTVSTRNSQGNSNTQSKTFLCSIFDVFPWLTDEGIINVKPIAFPFPDKFLLKKSLDYEHEKHGTSMIKIPTKHFHDEVFVSGLVSSSDLHSPLSWFPYPSASAPCPWWTDLEFSRGFLCLKL